MSNIANKRLATSYHANVNSQIPVARSVARSNSSAARNEVAERWKKKYEEAEKSRKALLLEKEKALRELKISQRKNDQFKLQNKVFENELYEKSNQLKQLTAISKKLYKEYDTLKTQYSLEKDINQKAFNEATQWYRQNRALKRQSAILLAGYSGPLDALPDVVDSHTQQQDPTDDKELEGLKQLVDQLTEDKAKLQAELNELRLQEFEGTEKIAELTQELENEKRLRESLETEVADLKNNNLQMQRVSQMLVEKNNELKATEEKRLEDIRLLKLEAEQAKKERNILAHQSSLLMQNIPGQETLALVQELEKLRGQLEDERSEFEMRIFELEEKLEERDCNAEMEVLEERIKLLETELEHARKKIEEQEEQMKKPPPAPAPPPPPPPPPIPFLGLGEPQPLLIRAKPAKLEDILGPKSDAVTKVDSHPGAIRDLINEIKEGKFTLRSSTRRRAHKPQREEPKVVAEMLNILGTLRRKQDKHDKNAQVN